MRIHVPLLFALTGFLLLLSQCAIDQNKNSESILQDNFQTNSQDWQRLSFPIESGEVQIKDGQLKLISTEGPIGVFHSKTFSGHFMAEASFVKDENIGLALFQLKDDQPDMDNFTILCVDTNEDGEVEVFISDRQNGVKDVLDNTGVYIKWLEEQEEDEDVEEEDFRSVSYAEDGFHHRLTGKDYSMPFTQTDGKIRILRDSNAGFFHYYYQVKGSAHGKEGTDWMELRPSKDWSANGTEFFVGLVKLGPGEAQFEHVVARQQPAADSSDVKTGFSVVEREYNWSGFIGDAVVVTFDDAFPYAQEDMKFVFWTEMNYIPAWHLSNQLLYTYEFVETWGGGNPGCHEPMSDRLRLWSSVDILEDNAVRKTVRWHYVLCDPDYRVPEDATGVQLPEVDEYWTFYPDGTGIRHVVYTPKLDSDHRAPHELGESIAIAGSASYPNDFYASPALTLLNLEGEIQDAHPGPKFDYYSPIDDWNQQIQAAHLNGFPDVFTAWSTDETIPETYSGYKIRYENAWHNTNGQLVHWPVNKRPYTNAFYSGGTWESEVSHSCVLSWGVRDGIDWTDNYKLDERGRKYREWASLVGLNRAKDYDQLKRLTRSWLYQGELIPETPGLENIGLDYHKKSILLEAESTSEGLAFTVQAGRENSLLINPVFEIKGWNAEGIQEVQVDGKTLPPTAYRTAKPAADVLLVWVDQSFEGKHQLVFH